MKPMHVAVLAAAVAVGAVLYLMAGSQGDRTSQRGGAERDAGRDGRNPTRTVQVTLGDKTADEAKGALAITLSVVGPDGNPAGGAEVELSGRSDARGGAGADGAARVDGLFPGFYDLVARKGRATGAVSFELKADRDLGTLRLAEAVAIRGTVLDARRKPVANAAVEAVTTESGGSFDLTGMARLILDPEAVAARARTGEDGVYELLVAKGGRFGLRVSAPGLAPEGEPSRVWTVDTEGLDFYLFPGVGLAGRVSDRRGQPVAGARVMLLDPMSVLARRIPKQETVTDAQGAFAVATTATEETMLVIRATGYATWMDGNLELPQHDLSIVLESGITLHLRAVRESDPERPAAGVNAMVIFNGSIAAGVTGDDGMLVVENLPRENTGAMGGADQAVFLWGGGFVAGKKDLVGKEPRDGLVDAGNVEMADGGIVRGRVLNRETGEPVRGAEVRSLGGQAEPELDFYAATTARSKDDGSYELRGVPLGASTVMGTHPDYVSTLNPMMMSVSRGPGAMPGTSSLFAAGAREARFDVELTPAAAITGQVVAPDGTPVAGAQVMVQDQMMAMMAMFGSGPQPATTDAEGRFTLAGLQRMQGVPVVASHRDWGSSRPRTARAGGEPVVLELSAPLRLKGKVVDEAGQPVEGVRVGMMVPSQGNRRGLQAQITAPARPTITGPDGRFVVANAPAGEWAVKFDHPEYIEGEIPVTLREGTPEHVLEPYTLRRGATIAGTVVGPDGEALSAVSVSVNAGSMRTTAPGAAAAAEPVEGRTWGSARADKEGRFAIHGLAATTFNLEAEREGYYAEPLEVAAGTTDVRVTLRQAGTIRGRVVDGFAQPVPGAQVTAEIVTVHGDVTERDHVAWTRTNAEGGFVLRSIPVDRAVTLSIDHDSYADAKIENVRAAEHEQVFRLDAGQRVSGTVVDPDGGPVGNVTIFVVAESDSKSVTTAADGTFEAGGLPTGPVTLHVQESGLNVIPAEIEDVRAGARGVRIVVQYGESISGVVVDATGKPALQVQVTATDATGNQVANDWIWDAKDGAFELRGLRRGTYRIEAQTMGENGTTESRAQLDGIPAGTKNLRLQLE